MKSCVRLTLRDCALLILRVQLSLMAPQGKNVPFVRFVFVIVSRLEVNSKTSDQSN